MSEPITIVCLSEVISVTYQNVDLTAACDAPADRPVHLTLMVHPVRPTVLEPEPTAKSKLTEGSLACELRNYGLADCQTTVRDGVLDYMQAAGQAQGYMLIASWSELSASPTYSYTLESGQQFDIYAAATFGEIITSGLLLSLIAVLVLKFCYQVVIK